MIDWDDAFDNSGYVPGVTDLFDMWTRQAAGYRTALDGRAELDLAYGPAPRERLDLFHPRGTASGVLVFVHGGYWHMMDKSHWSHLAAGALHHGWSVAIPAYPLAPDASISQIVTSITRALTFAGDRVAGPIRLCGHSAGGHLVSRMMCRDTLADETAARLARVTSISGVHDLRPLTATRLNETLKLTAAEAQAQSPALADPRPGIPATFWVGADERPEFLRQTRLIAERWGLKDIDVTAVYDMGRHHFNVLEPLADPDSALVNEVLR
ncbi:MAG: alpha/beta hydrolase fold domain-containing protein [Pseudomonadota bacterium]